MCVYAGGGGRDSEHVPQQNPLLVRHSEWFQVEENQNPADPTRRKKKEHMAMFGDFVAAKRTKKK